MAWQLRSVALLATTSSWLAIGSVAAAPKVVTSIKPVHALAAMVMQGVGTPDLLLKGGASAHSYTLKPSEARRLRNAQLIFWVGPQLEAFLVKPLRVLGRNSRTVALINQRGIVRRRVRSGGVWASHDHHDHSGHKAHKGHGHGHGHGKAHRKADVDGHIWLDIRNARAIVTVISRELARIDPANASRYRTNAQAARRQLVQLEQQVRRIVAPVRRRPYIVFHDAYQYFEKQFGLRPVGSITLEGEQTPGARRLYQIRSAILKRRARCVFVEPQFPPKLGQTVVEGTAAKLAVLDPLGAKLQAGPDAYRQLLLNLANNITRCVR